MGDGTISMADGIGIRAVDSNELRRKIRGPTSTHQNLSNSKSISHESTPAPIQSDLQALKPNVSRAEERARKQKYEVINSGTEVIIDHGSSSQNQQQTDLLQKQSKFSCCAKSEVGLVFRSLKSLKAPLKLSSLGIILVKKSVVVVIAVLFLVYSRASSVPVADGQGLNLTRIDSAF
ncbi:hypothetical protein RHGRI_010970 [Rhododendron griersonianum]|uniref:Uncharacterized protein n=1 Tax=Rhododendron griersonianum TaxID=479676 RepID=A0AAV6KK47_9ERIC|nr:hypothetical protein RHGRI_010970 [Rhododendron griersonianum]